MKYVLNVLVILFMWPMLFLGRLPVTRRWRLEEMADWSVLFCLWFYGTIAVICFL